MKATLIFILAACPWAYAQEPANAIHYQTIGPPGAVPWEAIQGPPGSPVQGAPYSATITSKSIRTLADGNHVVQTSTGTTARDWQGRTRQDVPMPPSAPNAPHLIFIHDPVAHASYALNLTDKTAQRMPAREISSSPGEKNVDFRFVGSGGVAITSGPVLAPPLATQVSPATNDRVSTEDLGAQIREGLLVNGVRTTRTIPAGRIGNAEPISIMTEVWTSPDLKAVVYSKRSDPLMGEETFQLSNISRAEPDPSLFIVPPDFKIVDYPEVIMNRPNQEN